MRWEPRKARRESHYTIIFLLVRTRHIPRPLILAYMASMGNRRKDRSIWGLLLIHKFKFSSIANHVYHVHYTFDSAAHVQLKDTLPRLPSQANLLPDIGEQIITSTAESSCRFALRGCGVRGGRSGCGCCTAPTTKVIVLRHLRRAPAGR